jgi:hypothetical protein
MTGSPPRPGDPARQPGTPAGRPAPAWHGLCDSCAHVRAVTSARGSTFLLCERSKSDPRYPKYPPQPVVRCAGFEPAAR